MSFTDGCFLAALNMLESMPADVNVSHIVLLDTGLCGRRVERNNFSQFGKDLNYFVAAKYVSKPLRGHSKLSSVKRGKAIMVRDLGSPVFCSLVSYLYDVIRLFFYESNIEI